MFELTKAAFKKTLEDFKKVVYASNVVTQLVYLVYLGYTLLFQKGNVLVNGILFGISFAYLLFFLIVTGFGKAPDGKETLKRSVKLICKWSKRFISLYNVGVMLYGISLTAKAVTPFALVLNAMMIVGFILGVVFDVLFAIIRRRGQLFIDGFEEDMAAIKQPVKNVGNFFKKITGQEIEEEEPRSKREEKNIAILQKIADKTREEKEAAKQAEKERVRLEKLEKKQAKKEAKLSRKAALAPAKELAATTAEKKKKDKKK